MARVDQVATWTQWILQGLYTIVSMEHLYVYCAKGFPLKMISLPYLKSPFSINMNRSHCKHKNSSWIAKYTQRAPSPYLFMPCLLPPYRTSLPLPEPSERTSPWNIKETWNPSFIVAEALYTPHSPSSEKRRKKWVTCYTTPSVHRSV